MNTEIKEIAIRIKGLREILGVEPSEMAETLKITEQEYLEYEGGAKDFTFTFLYKCANKLGVDIVELISGDTAKLNSFAITRKAEGYDITSRRKNFNYKYLAYAFKNKLIEPFVVTAPFKEEEQDKPIKMSEHKHQEMDFVLKGSLKMEIDGHSFVLEKGDSVYYDSTKPHGMIATGGKDCVFLAIVIRKQD